MSESVAEQIENKNVANILRKLQAGKVLTDGEKQQVIEWQSRQPGGATERGRGNGTGASPMDDGSPGEKAIKRLNPRQQAFVRNVVGGASYADAYRAAYNPKPNMGAMHIGVHAHRVYRRPGVAAAIAQLQRKTDGATLLTVNERLSILAEAAKTHGTSPAMLSAKARCIEVYNKTAGDSAPERQEVLLKGDPNAPLEVGVTRMTVRRRIDMLRRAREAEAAAAALV